MEIIVNQQIQQLPDNVSVEQLFNLLMPHAPKGVAIAVNQVIVPRSEWCAFLLHANDDVMLISATQGG